MRTHLAVLAFSLISLTACCADRRDPELEMVRAYLRENLNDPTWQEVKWYPARDLVERRAESIAEYREKLADAERRLSIASSRRQPTGPLRAEVARWRESLKWAEAAKPLRVCRLKYRTPQLGSKVLVDEVFIVEEKQVKAADELTRGFPGYWQQYFDDRPQEAKTVGKK